MPTENVVKKDHDFFVKRDTVGAIGIGAILPVLYAHMVLFPPSGGYAADCSYPSVYLTTSQS